MNDFLNRPSVLVLNRAWQAIFVKTPAEAIPMLCTDVATALSIDGDSMVPVKWKEWIELPIRDQDVAVHTSKRAIRVPTVIVLSKYAQVPKKRPKLSVKSIWDRDKGICQYTGRALKREEGNIDHVTPRSKGGATDWNNCVLADKKINSKKADKMPSEVGLRLLRAPVTPKEVPVTVLIKNPARIPDWDHFLIAG